MIGVRLQRAHPVSSQCSGDRGRVVPAHRCATGGPEVKCREATFAAGLTGTPQVEQAVQDVEGRGQAAFVSRGQADLILALVGYSAAESC